MTAKTKFTTIANKSPKKATNQQPKNSNQAKSKT